MSSYMGNIKKTDYTQLSDSWAPAIKK